MKRGLKIKLPLAFWSLSVIMALLVGCNKNAEQHPSTANVPLVIFDTDIGSSTDDLFALEMLYRYEEQGLCRLLGVVVDPTTAGVGDSRLAMTYREPWEDG